jgi:7-cyano-7-deazaguanine synthase in queuosine biosynthesis
MSDTLGTAPYTSAPTLSWWERLVTWWRTGNGGAVIEPTWTPAKPPAAQRACGEFHCGHCPHEEYRGIDNDHARLERHAHRRSVRPLVIPLAPPNDWILK